MRAWEMHPLCCISIDCPGIADPDPEPAAGALDNADGSDVIVAGVLHKWTNFGRGWRSRWFSLRNGVLTYAKIQSPPMDNPDPNPDLDQPPPPPEDVRLIGSASAARSRIGQQQQPIGFVYLKISSFRESKSDDRRFYIFSPRKTLHLRTASKEDRVAWIEALVSTRSKFSLNDKLSLVQNDVSFSTVKLRDRMHSEGLGEAVIKDCEQIMQSEFSEFQRQLKLRYEEHLHLVGAFRQHLEDVNEGDETRSIREGQLQLMKHEFSSSGRGKYSVSGYASSDGRPCKPFNPLLGETYEADFPEKGIRFFSEKVSHHPMLIACHCEGKGWKFWGDSNLRSKFWGRSIQLDPVGVLTLEFDDGEIFQWSKVTTSIYNLIIGKVHCDHHGTMGIQGNREYSCKLKFKEQSLFDRNPRQVQGFVEDTMGNKVAALVGKWDDSMYYISGDDVSKTKCCTSTENAALLWRRSKPPENPTRYNLSSFAITLNELTSGLQEKLPPTDSRLRPDQRYLENGEYEKAFEEKLRLETRQRMSCKLQENGWKPRWFQKDVESGTFRYMGGYWEAREQKKWEDCPDIFGEFSVDPNTTC